MAEQFIDEQETFIVSALLERLEDVTSSTDGQDETTVTMENAFREDDLFDSTEEDEGQARFQNTRSRNVRFQMLVLQSRSRLINMPGLNSCSRSPTVVYRIASYSH